MVSSIRPFQHRKMNPEFLERSLGILEQAIQDIYDERISSLSFEELYRTAYNTVLHNHGYRLYSFLETTLTNRLKRMAVSIVGIEGNTFLEQVNEKWERHVGALRSIRDIFMYMDRCYVGRVHKAPVHQLGLNLWHDHVLNATLIKDKILLALLDMIRWDRTGEIVNRSLMHNIARMLSELGGAVYQECFEKPFLEQTCTFYSIEAQQNIARYTCGDYLMKAEERLNEESERCLYCLNPSSEKKVANVVLREVLSKHMQTLIQMENSGLETMLVEDRYEDLARMHNLFGRFSFGLDTIEAAMKAHLCQVGTLLVTNPEKLKNPIDYVQSLLDLRDKYERILICSFKNNKSFRNAIQLCFENFVNLKAVTQEYLSLFVDDKFRRGFKDINENDIEVLLDRVMALFRYISDKDVFEKYYRQHLSKRLISGKKVLSELEDSMILKLKTECGYQYTGRMEGMLTDMRTSVDMMVAYNECKGRLSDGPNLGVQVLTTSSWPHQRESKCNLPREILHVYDSFKTYYLNKHSGRKLTLQTNLGQADLLAKFANGKRHELSVSTYQMCILMVFNDNESFSYKDIEQMTDVPKADLKRCLIVLSSGKGKNVLIKVPQGDEICESDTFHVNENFTSKLYKVKIGIASTQRETDVEVRATKRQLEEDRKPQIEAAIVRIMKARRLLDHSNLVAEVTKQLQARFQPSAPDIKRRVESLIEREILERDTKNMTLYKYVA